MTARYLSETLTPAVRAEEERYYGQSFEIDPIQDSDKLGEMESDFIARRDSFYIATVSSDGWPYIQHRGGAAGFLKVLDPSTVAFADFRGNRQLISIGNLAGNDRVSIFLIDYPHRQRIKILGRARVVDAREDPTLVARIAPSEARRKVERVVVIEVVGYDWNCPAHITPRYTEAEIREAIASGAFD